MEASLFSKPLPSVKNHSIIIDTDCGIDDMRAISLILSRHELKVKAILLSDGTLTPLRGLEKVQSLLHEFNRDAIPVALGDMILGINPPWRQFNELVQWGKITNLPTNTTTVFNCISPILKNIDEKIILVCLGPLTNVGALIMQNKLDLTKVEKIVWYNDVAKPMHGFNSDCDMSAVSTVIKSGIRLDIISNLNRSQITLDSLFLESCFKSDSMLGKILYSFHMQPPVLEKLKEKHFKLADELVAIYLTNPDLFDMTPMIPEVNVRYTKDYNSVAVLEVLSDMISGKYVNCRGVVFNSFPMKRDFFAYDVRQVMDSAIYRYGYDEWKANVMTDEFHGHLGVYSIVGAKMGIKAREWFGAGPDVLEVISYAGTKPPYSCLNDGIQVSVGATLGMGTIRVKEDTITQPMADFIYKNDTIRIQLKKEYVEKVDADINEGIVKFGIMDDGYWKLIRRNALKYWLQWDRNEIFDIRSIGKR